jgi:hypothetical protein
MVSPDNTRKSLTIFASQCTLRDELTSFLRSLSLSVVKMATYSSGKCTREKQQKALDELKRKRAMKKAWQEECVERKESNQPTRSLVSSRLHRIHSCSTTDLLIRSNSKPKRPLQIHPQLQSPRLLTNRILPAALRLLTHSTRSQTVSLT